MTTTEQDKELREKIDIRDSLKSLSIFRLGFGFDTYELIDFILADRKRVALEARIEPFDFVESCEPDCDDVRHAYHQGQWDMATRIKAQQEEV